MTKMIAALTLLVAALVSSSAQAADKALEKVSLRLDWVFGSEFAPIFLAKEKGFFTAEGIDLAILPGQGSTVTVKLVGNGDTPFGLAAADQVLIARSRGLPVKAITVDLQHSPSAIIFPTSTGIKTLKDLYGHTLGIQFKSATEKQWRAVAKFNHIDESKIREVPADEAIARLIEAKKIDAGVAFYFNDALKVIADGTPMSWILFDDHGLPFYSEALIVNDSLIKQNPDLVRRFTRAFDKGWSYAITHEQETLQSFLRQNPTVDAKYSALKLPEVLKLAQSADTKAHGFGWSRKEEWASMQKSLLEMGLQPQAIDIDQVFTNDYVAQ